MDAQLPARLLAHLRQALETSDLAYAEPPIAITGCFDTLIYGFRLRNALEEFSRPLILRVFREGNPWITVSGPERARLETAVQNTVASLGYPAPHVLHTNADSEVLGAPFLIMEHLPGRIMLDLFFRPSRVWWRLPIILTETQARLHALDPQPLVQAIEEARISARALTVDDWLSKVAQLSDEASLDGLRPGIKWLLANRPAVSPLPTHGRGAGGEGSAVICHGDFHPLNILMEKEEVSGVIDWPWLRLADPAYDVGATIAIFTQGPMDLPGFAYPLVNWFRRGVVRRYLSAYQRLRPLDVGAVRYYEAMRCLGFLLEAGQQRQADLGLIARPEKPTAFAARPVVKGIIVRFARSLG